MLNELVYTYLSLYQISIVIVGFMTWILISYIDRVHMRERARKYGVILSEMLSKNILSENAYDKFRISIIGPLCVIFEITAGFLEGIENLEPIITMVQPDTSTHLDIANNAHKITTKGIFIYDDNIDNIEKKLNSIDETVNLVTDNGSIKL